MRIAIIGGGWLGCHIGAKLKKHNHEVTLFEQSDIFAGSSFYNSNRLHKGFHYSRNKKTRELCYSTFDLFLKDYKELVEDITNNHYAIPVDNSLVDFGTFKSIFSHEEVSFIETDVNYLTNIEGCVVVDEKYINPLKAKAYFKDKLEGSIVIKTVTEEEITKLSTEYDYVINTTNNTLKSIKDCYFELSLALVYDKVEGSEFGSLTMVDGPLFSIYPYQSSSYNVTDVEYTPLFTSNRLGDIEAYRNSQLNETFINSKKDKIESKITTYYKDFNKVFNYTGYYTAIKVKRKSASADRFPVIQREGNIISCFTGKIQGIYILENYIKNEIINW
jgi:hypothetical protein